MNSKVEGEHSGEEQVNQEKGGDGASLVESREVENETNKEERRVEEVQEATEKLKLWLKFLFQNILISTYCMV